MFNEIYYYSLILHGAFSKQYSENGGKNLFSFLEPVFFAENVLQKCVVFNNQGILSIKKVAAHFIDKL